VLERLEAFCERNDYDFLRQSPDRGYHDHRAFVRLVRGEWLDRVDDELRSCTGLVEERQHEELFSKYVAHVSMWVKREKVYNNVMGVYEDPDMELMKSVEEHLDAGSDGDAFRKNLISTIAARAIDKPGEKVNPLLIFPRYVEKLREAYYGEHKKQVGTLARDALVLLDEGPGLTPERRTLAEATLAALLERHGYVKESAREALGELVEERYET
jgi:predicted Ser/Thr protein kinase